MTTFNRVLSNQRKRGKKKKKMKRKTNRVVEMKILPLLRNWSVFLQFPE